MRMLQEHLAWKRRSKPTTSIQIVKPINNVGQYKKSSLELNPSEEDEDEEYDPMHPNSYIVLQTKYLKDEEARLTALRNKSLTESSKERVPKLTNIIDLDD